MPFNQNTRIIAGDFTPWYDLPKNLRRLGGAGVYFGPLGALSGAGTELGAQVLEQALGRRAPGSGEVLPILRKGIQGLIPTPIETGPMAGRLNDFATGVPAQLGISALSNIDKSDVQKFYDNFKKRLGIQ